MKTIFISILFLTVLSCKNSEEAPKLDAQKIMDINEIVEVIVLEDSLPVLKNTDDRGKLYEDLIKLNILIPEKPKNNIHIPPLPEFPNISIDELLHHKKGAFFKSKDSLYIIEQNSYPEKLKIDKRFKTKFNLITIEEFKRKKSRDEFYSYYIISLPVFSLDNQNAYVELNHYCGGLCGSGSSIYLKKINGKWKIIDFWGNWIS